MCEWSKNALRKENTSGLVKMCRNKAATSDLINNTLELLIIRDGLLTESERLIKDQRCNLTSAFETACWYENIDVIKLLLAEERFQKDFDSCDIFIYDWKKTPLVFAVEHGRLKVA